MNTFDKHFRDFPAFIGNILSWKPDFLVPVAKKGCKLIKTVEHLPQLRKNADLIKYRSFFELTNPSVQGQKIAVVDDATQYTATLQEYRRFFENLGATVRTFSFVGHEDLFRGTRWKEDPLAEIEKPLPEPVYQEYILQQSYHLLKSGHHFDLDHLIFELKVPKERFDELLTALKPLGEILFVEDYFLNTGTRRFSLNQPSFFQRIPFLPAELISLGPIRKIKFAYDFESETLDFSPLVFPNWEYGRTDVGNALFRDVPFDLPYKLPDFLDKRNKSALLRAYYNIYFSCVVAFAKAFNEGFLRNTELIGGMTIKRNDLDAVLGLSAADHFISSVKAFVSGPETFDFGGPAPVWRKSQKPRYRTFADVIDDLKAAYARKIERKRSRVGVHHYVSYDVLFRRCADPISLSEDLDYYCDFGAIVPEIIFQKGRLLRGCRTGEANSEYNWKRTQILIPLAIDQFRSELGKTENEVEPTVLNKLLANFVFDYPSEANHELHCLIGQPYTFGTLVGAYHRHRAPTKPNLYRADIISPFYEWDPKKTVFRVRDRGKMIKEIGSAFDDRQEIPYAEIVTYFKFFSRIYRLFMNVGARPVDVLNMLSICREENCFYCHVHYNIGTALEEFGAFMDASGKERLKHLHSSKTNAQSAFDKIHLAKKLDETLKEIVKRFGRDVEFVKAVERLSKNHVPFGAAFKNTLQQLEELILLNLILVNLCLLVEKEDARYAEELQSLNAHRVLARNGISIPEKLGSFLQDTAERQQTIEKLYGVVITHFDSLPRPEPLLAVRLLNEARQRAKNVATSYVYKARLAHIALVYIDFSGLRSIPEPKENILSQYYQIIEQNLHRRGGKKLYGGSGGDDMFTILITEIPPALQCAKEIKKDFVNDLFLHSSKCDVKFGLSFVMFDGEQREQDIIRCWGNAKDCCEYKSPTFRNRGNLLVSQQTLETMRSMKVVGIEKFVPIPNESLKTGGQIFHYSDVLPLPASEEPKA